MKFVFEEAVELDAAKVRMTSDGYMVADTLVARSGIQLYPPSEMGLSGKAMIRVWRSPDEVFSKDSMATFAFKPVTVDHKFVDANNWKKVSVGHLGGEVARDGEMVRVPLIIMDATAIQTIKDGKRELSAGYTCDIEVYDHPQTAPTGEVYDAVQKNIRINHVAIVNRGKAGPLCRIGDAENVWGDAAPSTKEGRTMNTRTIMVDGLQVETTDAGAAAIEKLQRQLSEASGKIAAMDAEHKSALSAKDTELGSLKAELQKAKDAQIKPADLSKMIADRAALIGIASKIDPELKVDDMDDNAIRRAVVTKKLGADAVKDASDDVIKGMFAVVSSDAKSATTQDTVRTALREATSTGDEAKDTRTSQQKYEDRTANAWKGDKAA